MSDKPFSPCCYTCDDGMHIASWKQATNEGWIDIEKYDGWHGNYIGYCPACKLTDRPQQEC